MTTREALDSLRKVMRRKHLALTAARSVWERDRAAGVPVALPGRLGVKYPHAAHSWQWAWVFPSATTCECPRTRVAVQTGEGIATRYIFPVAPATKPREPDLSGGADREAAREHKGAAGKLCEEGGRDFNSLT